jgi:hypothetical protein
LGVYNQAGRYVIKRWPSAVFTWRAPSLWQAWKFTRWQDTRTLPFPGEPDRICDTVAEFENLADPRRRCLVDVEVQAKADADMLERLGEYAFRLRRQLRHGPGAAGKYPVLCLVLNLTGAEQVSRMEMALPEWTDAGLWLQVAQATLSTEDAGQTLARIASGELERWVLPWLPLLRGAAEPANITEWKRLAAQESDSRSRADLGGLAMVLAKLAGTDAVWGDALQGGMMTESPFVNEWLAAGYLRAQVDVLRRTIQLRFGMPVPTDLEDQLTALKKAAELDLSDQRPLRKALAELERWFDAAVTAPSLDAFRAAVQKDRRKRKRSH